MPSEPLDSVPLTFLFVLICTLTLAAMEAGYRFGRWRKSHYAEEKEAPVGAMVASILALLAFLVAFTFNLSATRFDARRQAVLDEANDIGTTYLRTDMLPKPQRDESKRILQEYVEIRLSGVKSGTVSDTIARSEELHSKLWQSAVRAAESDRSPMTALYFQSLNQLIDQHAIRVQLGLRNRLPFTLWVGLIALSILGMGSVGYQAGLSATRRSPAMLGLILGFAGILYLIADLDRPNSGSLEVSQQALIDLQRSINVESR